MQSQTQAETANDGAQTQTTDKRTDTDRSPIHGEVTDAETHDDYGRAEVTLTVECDDGETFEATFDCQLNVSRQAKFRRLYGVRPPTAEGTEVNVVPGDDANPRHILLTELPLKKLSGEVVIPADADLPVEMRQE
jgi:hypothetical protein